MTRRINGRPVFKVGFADFTYVVSLFNDPNKRMLTRNISSPELSGYIRESRSRDCYVEYCGILLDMGKSSGLH